jgi:hypothetical protein
LCHACGKSSPPAIGLRACDGALLMVGYVEAFLVAIAKRTD